MLEACTQASSACLRIRHLRLVRDGTGRAGNCTLRGHERDAVELTLLTDLHRELQHASTDGYCMSYTEYQPEASARVPLPYRNGIAASLASASG